MALTLTHKNLLIELFEDSRFLQNPDSPTSYAKVIQVEECAEYSPKEQHAIKIYRNEELINSAIILASGGGTGIHSDSALIDDDNLIIRCCNKLFSLTLPGLETNWAIKPDWATCFSIHKYQDTFISRGEIAITRIDKRGKILWNFSGMDIFVCLYKGNPFELFDTHIALMDFGGYTYKIDYDGNLIGSGKAEYDPAQRPGLVNKRKKPWWKFW